MFCLKKIVFVFCVMISCTIHARTVRRYEIKQPGKAAPIRNFRNPIVHQDQPYVHDVDESVLQQIQFKRLKEIELEGRESYQVNRKADITRTY